MLLNVQQKDKIVINKFICEDNIFKKRYTTEYLTAKLNKFYTVKNYAAFFHKRANEILSYGIYHLFAENNEDLYNKSFYTHVRLNYLHHLAIKDEQKYVGGCDTYHMRGMKKAIILEDNKLLNVYFKKYPQLSQSSLFNNKSQHNFIYYVFNKTEDKNLVLNQIEKAISAASTKYEKYYFSCLLNLLVENKEQYFNDLKKLTPLYLRVSSYDKTLNKFYCEDALFLAKLGMKVFSMKYSDFNSILYITAKLLISKKRDENDYLNILNNFSEIKELMISLPLNYELSIFQKEEL